MTTVAEIDRLVLQDDKLMAALLPRLGPKVRAAYAKDRDSWIVLRTGSAAGRPISPADLSKHKQAFAGWLRALRTKTGQPGGAPRPSARAAKVAAPVAATARPGGAAPPASAAVKSGHHGAWLAAGAIAVGLVGLGMKRRRS